MSRHHLAGSRRGRDRATIVVLLLALAARGLFANDLLQRTIAYAEATTPAAVLLVQGVESLPEYSAFVGAVLLLSVPNVFLLSAESAGSRQEIVRWRLVSSTVGLVAGAVGLAGGVAASFGALDGWGLRPYSGSLLAWSLPALLAGFVDLIPYEAESDSP